MNILLGLARSFLAFQDFLFEGYDFLILINVLLLSSFVVEQAMRVFRPYFSFEVNAFVMKIDYKGII